MSHQEKITITRKSGKVTVLPPEIIPEAEDFVIRTIKKIDSDDGEFSDSHYGHAAATLVSSFLNAARLDPENQDENLRVAAKEIIGKQGPGIIPLLRDELRLALTDEDFEMFAQQGKE